MTPDITYAYDLLQVSPAASDKEMRAAWRKLVRRYHPDLVKTNPEEASRRMGEINAAYDAVAHHRAVNGSQEKPQSRARRHPRAARQAAERDAWRSQRDASARKAAKAWKEKQKNQTARQKEAPAQRQTSVKKTAKWSRAEQTLINTARAAFESTRKTLSNAARRPEFSACH